VLGEREVNLEQLGIDAIEPPEDFGQNSKLFPGVSATAATQGHSTNSGAQPARCAARVPRGETRSRNRESGTAALRGHRDLARRAHRARSKSNGPLRISSPIATPTRG
jgi:hypothetical protein